MVNNSPGIFGGQKGKNAAESVALLLFFAPGHE